MFFVDTVKSSDAGKLSLRNSSFDSCPFRHLSLHRASRGQAALPSASARGFLQAQQDFIRMGGGICPSAYLRVKGSSVTEDNSAALEYYILIVYLENNILY